VQAIRKFRIPTFSNLLPDIDSDDTYVRVTGQLKSFHNKRHIGAHHIRLVTDHNEVIFHLLEATSIHLFNTRGPPDGSKPDQPFQSSDAMDGIIAGNTSTGNPNSNLGHLEPLQRRIMMLVHEAPPTNEGVHVQTIAQTLRVSSASVMQAVEQLTIDGLLYTTIDDDHVDSP
jgi:replication factor A2